MLRLYLAGPDIFLPNAREVADAKKALCLRHGFHGEHPLDLSPSPGLTGELLAWTFYRGCRNLARGCDITVANLTPFRGPHADVGTVAEIAIANEADKIVYGYSNDPSRLIDRIETHFLDKFGKRFDMGGFLVEDFGLHDNLMVDNIIKASGGKIFVATVPESRRWEDLGAFEVCLIHLKEFLTKH